MLKNVSLSPTPHAGASFVCSVCRSLADDTGNENHLYCVPLGAPLEL